MRKNILIKTLETLSRKEMTRFREFSVSPYFNKNKEVQLLIAYLGGIFPDFIDKKCQREIIFKKIYPTEKHNQPKLALLFTYSLRLLERFLVTEQLENEYFQSKLNYLKQLRQRNLFEQYEKQLMKLERGGLSENQEDQNNFELPFHLAREKDLYYNLLYKTDQNHNLEQKQKYLDLFFFTEKLKDACEMKFRNQILNIDFELNMLENVLQEVESKPKNFQSHPSISIYSSIYKTLTNKEIGDYYRTLEVLKKHEIWLPLSELQNIYNYLQNYCIRQINRGEQSFLLELFKIYQSQLEKGLLLIDQFLPEWHYKNIVTTGLRLKENDWVRSFIEDYKRLLKPSTRENAYSYNLASYYYSTRQFEKVLDLLTKVEYTDIRYNTDAKSLLLRTWYDLEEEEAFYSLIEAFRQFLKRNRLISEFQKAGYYNLIKFARKAFHIKTNLEFVPRSKSKAELEKLGKEIQSVETIFNQSWLEGKIENLKSMMF